MQLPLASFLQSWKAQEASLKIGELHNPLGFISDSSGGSVAEHPGRGCTGRCMVLCC